MPKQLPHWGRIAETIKNCKTLGRNPYAVEPKYNASGMCSGYAISIAERFFPHLKGMYRRGHAWELGKKNRVVWRHSSKRTYESSLKPGRLLGICLPGSLENVRGVPYTHIAVYMGKRNGKHIIYHNVNGKLMQSDLLGFLKSYGIPDRKAELIHIIAPLAKSATKPSP